MNQVTSQVAGRNPIPALDCGVWPVSAGGDDNFYAMTILPTGLQVTDTAAEAALAQANVNLAQVHVDLGTTNSDLGQLHTDIATTVHTDLEQLHTDLGTANSDLATIVANTTVVAPAGHVRCFQVTNNGSVQVIVPASADGRGKTVTNASVQAAANGADQWVGPAGVTAGNGHYLGPGSSMSFSGREAIYVNGVSGLTTALEEYT